MTVQDFNGSQNITVCHPVDPWYKTRYIPSMGIIPQFKIVRAVYTTFDLTTDVLSQRARCNNCGVKGNNTFQIVYRGGSYNALIGAANTDDEW